MSQTLESLLTLLNLEEIEEGPFRGRSEDLGLRQVFGGQVVGQALYAAKEAVPDEQLVHSFRSYFLRPGDSKKPIIYGVETLRDGNSSSARWVSVVQNDKPIFYMITSFQALEAGLEHQKTTPPIPAPDGLSSETQITQSLAHLLPPVLKDKFIYDRPPEIRPAEFHNPLKGHVVEPCRQVWIRANDSMPSNPCVHQYPLGYVSDLNFLPVALQPHSIGFLEPGIQTATIGHPMWLHRPFSSNEWLLYNTESTSASNARGFVCGEFYTQDDVLAASTVQEGVMRDHN